MTLRKAMMFALMIGGIALNTVPATAQDADEVDREQILITGTVDCRYQLRPAEVEICSTPVLAAMDLQMTTLFNILNLLVKQETGLEMAATQQQFLKDRANCASDANCIGQAYATRIGELDEILKQVAAGGPY